MKRDTEALLFSRREVSRTGQLDSRTLANNYPNSASDSNE